MKNKNTNSKKGFTLIEIIVTVAIMAILAGIAIPVIGYRLDQSIKNTALTNAHTIEYAIKEAQAAQGARDTSIYPTANTTPIRISDVSTTKSITNAFDPITYRNVTYNPAWCNGKVYFVNGTTSIDGETLMSKTDITASSSLAVSTL